MSNCFMQPTAFSTFSDIHKQTEQPVTALERTSKILTNVSHWVLHVFVLILVLYNFIFPCPQCKLNCTFHSQSPY